MNQRGFFDLSRRYKSPDKKKDQLVSLASLVPWELFRPKLHAALAAPERRTPVANRNSGAGGKPWDEVLIFKALVVQALYPTTRPNISCATVCLSCVSRPWPRRCGARCNHAVAVSRGARPSRHGGGIVCRI